MRLAKSARCCLVAMLGLVFIVVPIAPAAPEEPYKTQIDALRKAMEKYKDYKVAVRDLYCRPSAACTTPAKKWPATCTTPRVRWVFTL